MRGRYDRTDLGPSSAGSSLSFMGRANTGKRPIEARCDNIDSCPVCADDAPFKYPVVSGDLIYLQFMFADYFNSNPATPTAGWYTGSPSGDYWLEATLEFGIVPDLALPSGSIIRSQSVGYSNGSYQNIILDSAQIQNYIVSQGYVFDCFRLKVETFRNVPAEYTQVVYLGSTLPDASEIEDGLVGVQGGDFYIVVNSAWVYAEPAVAGQIIFNVQSGLFYEFISGTNWDRTTRAVEKEAYQTCYSHWHQLIQDCVDTVLIRANFALEDCSGHYYGSFQSQLPYVDQYRLRANIEMISISTEKTVNDNDFVTDLKMYENWILRNHPGLPVDVIRRLANSFSSSSLFIDNNEYINPTDLTKINEQGEYWYINPTLQRLLCEKESDCNDDFSFNPIVECPDPNCPDPGDPVTVSNSDDSFSEVVPCGSDLELEDYSYEVFVDGVSEAAGSFPAMVNMTINITITG